MSVCHVSVHPFVHVPIFRVSMRQCDLCYLLSTRPARAFPDCTSSAHRPCIDRTKRIGEASTDRRTSDARYAWPAIRTTAERMRIARIEFRAGRNSSRRTRTRPERAIVSLHATPYEEMQQAPGHVSSRSKLQVLTPTNITAYRPQHRPAETATHTPTHAARHPRCTAPEKNSRPRTDAHHDISPIAPPSRSSSPHTPPHATKHPRHTALEKNGRSPHRRTQQATPPSSAPTQRKAATAPSPGPGKPQGAPAAVQPDRRGRKRSAPRRSRQAPSRTTSRHKRKSARTERSVCADLHRVQGYPCGDITSSCRRWSSWRPSEPKPSLRQPSGPSERQPSWVRPF